MFIGSVLIRDYLNVRHAYIVSKEDFMRLSLHVS